MIQQMSNGGAHTGPPAPHRRRTGAVDPHMLITPTPTSASREDFS